LDGFWHEPRNNPDEWSEDERILRTVPQYVLDHAPYVHLFSGEEFWPSDIAEHLLHTKAHINYTDVPPAYQHLNLSDLNRLNRWGRGTFLKSVDNVEERPRWLGSKYNTPERPDSPDYEKYEHFPGITDPRDVPFSASDPDRYKWEDVGKGDIWFRKGRYPSYPPGRGTPWPEGPAANWSRHWHDLPDRNDTSRLIQDSLKMKDYMRTSSSPSNSGNDAAGSLPTHSVGGRSDAPAVLVVVDKGDDVVDAFWFFFYSYNLGNTVLNVRFGNHVGDWEHTMVRFHQGQPKLVFFSEHSGGEAYGFEAVEKLGKRPVVYSATGTHAMYATPGVHAYVLPFGLLHDQTDRGPLWDPALNIHAYTYNYRTDELFASTLTPHSPIGYFYFAGHWGDKIYPLSDPRQYRFAGEYHYVDGPLGPRFKNLGRRRVCQGGGECVIKHWLGMSGIKAWRGRKDAEEEPEPPPGHAGGGGRDGGFWDGDD